jgi:hypothetical protein
MTSMILWSHQGRPRTPRLLALLLLLAATGCATRPPAVSIASLDAVSGKWEGVIYTRNGPLPATITIDRRGTFETVVNGRPFPGVVTVDNGKLRIKGATTGRTGVWTLHQANGQKVLVLQSDDGQTSGEARPVK